LKRARTELIAAIKDGKSLAGIEGILTQDLQEMSDVQIERFSRTKHTEVLNRGRLEYFKDSEVVSGYQYSAILDDVTSDICSGLDGKKFKDGDEPVPPMHFNCRSVLIPITKYEEFKPSDTARGMPIDDFIEENKGQGFAKFDTKEQEKITRLEVDSPGVDFDMQVLDDGLTQRYTYSHSGKAFLEVDVSFEDKTRKVQKSIKRRRLDESRV
jgi:SPP1 gp7 family putative phage head morphogenesis protein